MWYGVLALDRPLTGNFNFDVKRVNLLNFSILTDVGEKDYVRSEHPIANGYHRPTIALPKLGFATCASLDFSALRENFL